MQLLDIHLLHQLVGDRIIVNMGKGIIEQVKSDSFLLQLVGQPGMPVEVELQTKRTPGWHTQITKSELRMDEIEVVVQAFAAIPQQISSPSALVVPGPVGRTGLQSRKDVHQPGLFPALLDDLLDAVFLAKILLANVLDL